MQRLNGLRSSDDDEVLSSIVLWLKSVDLRSIAGAVASLHTDGSSHVQGKTLLWDVCDAASTFRRFRHSETPPDSSGRTVGNIRRPNLWLEGRPAGDANEVLIGNF